MEFFRTTSASPIRKHFSTPQIEESPKISKKPNNCVYPERESLFSSSESYHSNLFGKMGLGFLIFLVVLFFTNCREDKKSPQSTGDRFAIATDHPLASQVGQEIFQRGGNVVDSYVAASFVISVVRPQSTGLGGGGFALVDLVKNQDVLAFDFRERAPYLSTRGMYRNSQSNPTADKDSLFGYRSVAVPGMVKGLLEIHSRFGELPLEDVLMPALRIAEEGFTVYGNLEESIAKAVPDMNSAMKDVFLPGGKPLKRGDILIQKDLAKTILGIMKNGEKEFYQGETADQIHRTMLTEGGILRKKDLASYRVKVADPIRTDYRGHEIIGFPPPSSAIFLFRALKILEKEDLKNLYSRDKISYYSFLIEAMGIAYQDRSEYGGDPDFVKIPSDRLLSSDTTHSSFLRIKDKLSSQKGKIIETKPPTSIPETMESYNTTHITVTDREGNTVSSTHSINYTFGSRVMIPQTGIIMNDTMDDFVTDPDKPNAYGLVGGKANSISPGKTPLSSMSPTIVKKDGKTVFSLGAPGGSFIITSVLNTILHRIDLGMDPLESVQHPRLHFQFSPDIVFLDIGMEEEQKKLEKLGYKTKIFGNKGKVFLTEILPSGKIIAVSDPRGQGAPSSF